MVQSLCTLVSLKRSKRQLANTPFVEKEEAREVGLCREVHLGLQMLVNQNTNFKQGEPISSYQGERERWKQREEDGGERKRENFTGAPL